MYLTDKDYNPRKIKGVFFDLYGTLFVYGDMDGAWDDWLKVMYASLRKGGLRLDEEAFALQCEGFFTRNFSVAPEDKGRYTVHEQRHIALCRRLGVEVRPDAILPAVDTAIAAWQRRIRFDEKAYAVLKELKGKKKLALITNFDHPPHIHRLLNEYALDRFFEHITISSEVEIDKPDPRIFALTLERAGLLPGETVFVGDSVEDDVRGARAAGLYPILIRRSGVDASSDFSKGGLAKAARPTAAPLSVISSLTEIFKYL
jgi:putative hydrolase of the HAD superfamily